jgi:hypothetical protein
VVVDFVIIFLRKVAGVHSRSIFTALLNDAHSRSRRL